MSMTDKEAAAILRNVQAFTRPARGDGKSGQTLSLTAALSRAISALEREPRPVIVKGRLFKHWYCPACFRQVKKGGHFCHACGQAYRARNFYDDIERINIPPTPRHDRIKPPQIVIFDELHNTAGGGTLKTGERRGTVDKFKDRLQRTRERRRISRKTLAELCGLSKNTIARYERGERVPSLTDAAQIADALGVSLDYLSGHNEKNF